MEGSQKQGPEPVYFTPLTPLVFLERSAAVFRDKTAVVYGETRYTYQEFQARVYRLAHALRRIGIQKDDRVAFLAPNIPPMLEAHFGVPFAGGVLVAINIRLSPDEIAYILNHAEAKVLFVDTAFASLIEPIREKLEFTRTFVNIADEEESGLEGPEYEEFLQSGSPEPIAWSLQDEYDLISINYTSGTTGRPKGVMYHHRGAYLNALGEVLETGMNSDSVYLWTLPMFHCNGWCFTWGVTAIGGTHVCLRKFDPAAVFALIQQERVTHFCGAPTVLISLVNHPAAQGFRLDYPLRVVTAAAPPSPTILQKMEELGAEVTHVYGLTETYGPHTVCEWQAPWDALSPEERARKKARQGVPYIIAGTDLRVVDEQMRDVPADGTTMGEVVMRGNNVMKGYFKQPEATAEAFRGGWFHSGDLGVMHPDGYIELRDRKKDIIISGGENISTIEVEQTIARHPAVLEVAVIAIPDDKWGEVPKAFVTLKPGMTATEEEIITFCREHLAHFKCPKAVEFGELPKTSTGKIQKYLLREKEWAGYEKRIH
ncbi:MAG: long-chain-fatty-acid--CoA ligase [Nitrospinota bacterium]|nr:MAG: long-chain-fatty-acid--CoA ligase [Nitrospinota bacterium]